MAEAITLESLSAALRREVQGFKGKIASLAKDYGIARDKLKEIAPKVMALFDKIKGEQPGTRFTLADFARLFDTSVPTHPRATAQNPDPGYTANRTYNALDYMQRSLRPPRRGRQGVWDPATAQIPRLLATILQIVVDHDLVWTAVREQFNIQNERTMKALQNKVQQTKPLLDLSGLKPAKSAKVVRMEPIKREDVGQVEQLRQVRDRVVGRRRVRVVHGERAAVA